MAKLIARHKMRAVSGKLYLVDEVKLPRSLRLELPDGTRVRSIGGSLYRIVGTNEDLRPVSKIEIGSAV